MVQATVSIFDRDAAPTPATQGLQRWFQPLWSCGVRSPNFAELPVASSGHWSHVPRGQAGRLGGFDAVGPPGACARGLCRAHPEKVKLRIMSRTSGRTMHPGGHETARANSPSVCAAYEGRAAVSVASAPSLGPVRAL